VPTGEPWLSHGPAIPLAGDCPRTGSAFRVSEISERHAEQIIDAALQALDLLSVTIESCVHVRLPHAVAVARSQQLVR